MFLQHPDITEIIAYRNEYTNRLCKFIDMLKTAHHGKPFTYTQLADYLAIAVQDTELERVILTALNDLWPKPADDYPGVLKDYTDTVYPVNTSHKPKRGRPAKAV